MLTCLRLQMGNFVDKMVTFCVGMAIGGDCLLLSSCAQPSAHWCWSLMQTIRSVCQVMIPVCESLNAL